MAGIIYMLCALTALLCSAMLFGNYRRTGYRLLLWGALCFAGLTMNNLLLVLDKLVFVDISLLLWRHLSAVLAMSVLIYGLVWESE